MLSLGNADLPTDEDLDVAFTIADEDNGGTVDVEVGNTAYISPTQKIN